mgnify:CR=1 FL=1
MVKQPEHGVGFTEQRDSFELYQIPYYEDIEGVAPCGAIVSNIEDLSHWLDRADEQRASTTAGRSLPADVLKQTLQPAIGLPNTAAEQRGFWEILNSAYGMGRQTASYRGHLITYHGGDLPGFHSQVSFMPKEKIGVVVLGRRQPHGAALQLRQLQRLRAPPRPGRDAVDPARPRHPAEGQGGRHGRRARSRRGIACRTPSRRTRSADYVGELREPAHGVPRRSG